VTGYIGFDPMQPEAVTAPDELREYRKVADQLAVELRKFVYLFENYQGMKWHAARTALAAYDKLGERDE